MNPDNKLKAITLRLLNTTLPEDEVEREGFLKGASETATAQIYKVFMIEEL